MAAHWVFDCAQRSQWPLAGPYGLCPTSHPSLLSSHAVSVGLEQGINSMEALAWAILDGTTGAAVAQLCLGMRASSFFWYSSPLFYCRHACQPVTTSICRTGINNMPEGLRFKVFFRTMQRLHRNIYTSCRLVIEPQPTQLRWLLNHHTECRSAARSSRFAGAPVH